MSSRGEQRAFAVTQLLCVLALWAAPHAVERPDLVRWAFAVAETRPDRAHDVLGLAFDVVDTVFHANTPPATLDREVRRVIAAIEDGRRGAVEWATETWFDAARTVQEKLVSRIADHRTDEAARILLDLATDPSLHYFDGETAFFLHEDMVSMGQPMRRAILARSQGITLDGFLAQVLEFIPE